MAQRVKEGGKQTSKGLGYECDPWIFYAGMDAEAAVSNASLFDAGLYECRISCN